MAVEIDQNYINIFFPKNMFREMDHFWSENEKSKNK